MPLNVYEQVKVLSNTILSAEMESTCVQGICLCKINPNIIIYTNNSSKPLPVFRYVKVFIILELSLPKPGSPAHSQ